MPNTEKTMTAEEYLHKEGAKAVSNITKNILEFHAKHPIKELTDFADQQLSDYKERMKTALVRHWHKKTGDEIYDLISSELPE